MKHQDLRKALPLFGALTAFLVAACLEEGEGPVGPTDPEGPIEAPESGASDLSPALDRCPLLPEMRTGVVTCKWLAETGHPECLHLNVPPAQTGLHLIPGQEGDVRTPAFCVVASGPDSWCMREPE